MAARSMSANANRQEVEASLAGLTDDELIKLKRIAQLRAHGLVSMDWNDLLQEAIARTLAGSRVWPKDVPLLAFLAQTMRSIANEAWLNFDRSGERPSAADSEESRLLELAASEIDPEREAAAADALRHVLSIFTDDPDAMAVLAGLADGLSPSEVQQMGQLTPLRYAAAQKRIRRRLVSAHGRREIL